MLTLGLSTTPVVSILVANDGRMVVLYVWNNLLPIAPHCPCLPPTPPPTQHPTPLPTLLCSMMWILRIELHTTCYGPSFHCQSEQQVCLSGSALVVFVAGISCRQSVRASDGQ